MEYMVSTYESQISVGGDEIYLNAERFNQPNHAEMVNKLFSEGVDGYPSVPVPRPTWTHTYDFGCTFTGVQFLDRECKNSVTNPDKGFLVLYCLDQLVTQDVVLCMLTTSEHFHFYRQDVVLCMLTTSEHFHFYRQRKMASVSEQHWQTNSYKLGQVGEWDIYQEDWIEKQPTLVQEILVVGNGGIVMEKIQ